jgi:hypothetical protein
MTLPRAREALFAAFLAALGACEMGEPVEDDPATVDEEALVDESAALEVPGGPEDFPKVGSGYFNSRGIFSPQAQVCLKSDPVWSTAHADSGGEVTFDVSQETVETDFNLGLDAKVSLGLFSGSVKSNFMKRSRSDERSITYVHRMRVTLGEDIFDPAEGYSFPTKPSSALFYPKCGDYYTAAVKKGGSLYIIVKLDFASVEDRIAFDAVIEANYLASRGKGTMDWSKHAFSGRVHVSITAYQQGGKVAQLGNLFDGTHQEEGMTVLNCSLEDFKSCRDFIAAANGYSSTFANGLKISNAADLSYLVKPWTEFSEAAHGKEKVPADIQEKRDFLLGKVNKAADVDNRIVALERAQYFGAPPSFVDKVKWIKTINAKNVPIIQEAVYECFDGFDATKGAAGKKACLEAATYSALTSAGYKSIATGDLDVPAPKTYSVGGRQVVDTIRPEPAEGSGENWGNFGSWRPWKMCGGATFVTGYAMQVEGNQGGGDDTALNGVKIFCDAWAGGESHSVDVWKGAYGGAYQSSKYCPHGAINGFNIRVEESVGGSDDDSGANDLKALCTSGDTIKAPGGQSEGKWLDEYAVCPAGTAVCGMRVLYENPYDGDETSVNNVEFACCNY